jgi:macrodomain Ter protein organizer (MatP/YcbG family)
MDMKRTHLDRLITTHVLDRIAENGEVTELALQNAPEGVTRQLCAKVSPQLAERVEQTCRILNLSKRRFIEAAIITALDEADQILEWEDFYEAMGVMDDQHE